MLCIPKALGIPGFADQPPQWWVQGDVFQGQLDDPRWNNAVNRSYGNGAGREAAFRAVYASDGAGKPYLYLTFQVYTDPTASQGFDMVYLGLKREAANSTTYIVRVFGPADTSDHVAGQTGGIEWSTLKSDGTLLQVPGTNLPDLKDRHWLEDSLTSNTFVWAINLRVPVTSTGDLDSNGINLGNIAGGAQFRLWYAIVYSPQPIDPNDPANGIGIPYYWPRTAAFDDSGFDTIFPPATAWDLVGLGSGGNCGPGVSLDPIDIGVEIAPGQPLSSSIKASLTQTETNKMAVRPKNNGAVGVDPAVPALGIEAIVRIANWGSQTPWDQTGASGWQRIPFGSTAANQNPSAIAPGSKGSITFDWTISTSLAATFVGPNATRTEHQCLFVQLKNHANPAVDFNNDSAYNNMWFVKTGSPFVERAEISVRGRTPAPHGASRRVYVFVERTNMPRALSPGEEPYSSGFRLEDLVARRGDDAHELSIDAVAGRVPTIRYHVFYPTGKKLRVGGRVLNLYEPQTSFGYLVSHQGDVHGWEEALQPALPPSIFDPPPAQPIAIGDGGYLIEVPANGSVVVTTVVAPVEQPGTNPIPPPPTEPWWKRLIRAVITFFRKLLHL